MSHQFDLTDEEIARAAEEAVERVLATIEAHPSRVKRSIKER